MYLGYYGLSKTCLDHSLKSAASEHPFSVNVLNCPKHLLELLENTFVSFFITLRRNDFENMSLSEI